MALALCRCNLLHVLLIKLIFPAILSASVNAGNCAECTVEKPTQSGNPEARMSLNLVAVSVVVFLFVFVFGTLGFHKKCQLSVNISAR